MADEEHTLPHRRVQFTSVITCKRCGREFQRVNTRNRFCKPCSPLAERERAAERRREWRVENPEHARNYQKTWITDNLTKVYAYNAARRRAQGAKEIGSTETCTCGRRYEFYHPSVKSCKDCAATKRRDDAIARAAAWNKENNDKRNKQFRDRYSSDPRRRLNITMTNGIAASLKGKKAWQTWKRLVPYTLDELAKHIERQFTGAMSWENMGKWHIDHIVPLRLFNFTSPSDTEFLAAWALTNLRPLWAPENLRKNGRRTHLL